MRSAFPLPAVEAALRQAASGPGAVQLYLADPDGRLVWAAASADGPDLAAVAEALGDGPALLDLRSVTDAAGVGVAMAWAGARRGAVLALAAGTVPPPGTRARVADAAAIVQALVAETPAPASDATRLLADLATMPGTFDERLATALDRLAGVLAMDAAALILSRDDAWTPLVAADPHSLLAGVALAETPCAITVLADGPVGVPDGDGPFGAFLGAPVYADGRCAGALCAVARRARAPFTDAERGLVEALARWAGVALAGRQAAVRLAEREATLAAFLDTVPLGLGTLDLDADALGGVRLVTANVHAAHAMGATDLLPAVAASDLLAPWAEACHQAFASGTTARFAFDARRDGRPRRYEATVVVLDPAVPRFSFVSEDVTDRGAGAQAAGGHPADDTAADARRARLAHVAHELRSPLTAILGYADLLDAASPPDEIAEAREVITRAGGQMLEALNGLSALSDPEVAAPVGEKEAVAEAVLAG